MTIAEIIELSALAIVVLGLIATIVKAIIDKSLTKFVKEKMVEAEQSGMTGTKKLEYVLDAVKEKYKLTKLVGSARKLIESIIDISKKINVK